MGPSNLALTAQLCPPTAMKDTHSFRSTEALSCNCNEGHTASLTQRQRRHILSQVESCSIRSTAQLCPAIATQDRSRLIEKTTIVVLHSPTTLTLNSNLDHLQACHTPHSMDNTTKQRSLHGLASCRCVTMLSNHQASSLPKSL